MADLLITTWDGSSWTSFLKMVSKLPIKPKLKTVQITLKSFNQDTTHPFLACRNEDFSENFKELQYYL